MIIRKKYHLVKWDRVCKSKEEGNLGIRSLKELNATLHGKWLWRLGDGLAGLWKQLLICKYDISRNGWDVRSAMARCSGLWKGILYVKEKFSSNIRFKLRVGNRVKILFWLNWWVGESCLASLFPDLFRCARDERALEEDYLERSADHIVGVPIFRRNLTDAEVAQFRAMMLLIGNV